MNCEIGAVEILVIIVMLACVGGLGFIVGVATSSKERKGE